MATQQAADVFITNGTDGTAWILLSHSNASHGTQTGSWTAAPGETVGPLQVLFQTGGEGEPVRDYWSVLMHVRDGSEPGFYASGGLDSWNEHPLREAHAGGELTFSVGTAGFSAVPGPTAAGESTNAGEMARLTPHPRITHVFVVMLENHSFDNLFAMSGIPGITAATTQNYNTHLGNTYHVQRGAPPSMPTDPGHEFADVVEQLAGENVKFHRHHPYPPIDNSGFAANYATSASEKTGVPCPDQVADVMACFATETQLPVLYQLATQFAICDRWYSSLPGPTWPNRFFVHGASSSGLDDSPSPLQVAEWETFFGFRYPHGSIYHALQKAGVSYRFYRDVGPGHLSLYSDDPQNGSAVGSVPQVASLHGVSLLDREFRSLRTLAADLQAPYPHPYTFIEPHYGELLNDHYTGGSSQHPMDDVYGGENLLAHVYSAIRNSPYWDTSLLIVTYDEHGGLYDSVAPGPAPKPGDGIRHGHNKHGFEFDVYGVRVPAVVVSPLIPAGTVNHTVYDHASVPRTLEELFGMHPLTQRDAKANSVVPLLSLETPRTDCPTVLNPPAPLLKAATPPMTPEERALNDARPLPESGNLVGTMYVLRKTELELSGGADAEAAAMHAAFTQVQTRGQARAYAASVLDRVEAFHQARERAERSTP